MSLSFEVKVSPGPTLTKLAERYQISKFPIIRKGTRLGAKIVAKLIRGHAPRKTGELRSGIKERETGPLSFIVTEEAKYGAFQRKGVLASKINPILPRKKKALWWPGLLHPVAAVRRHPGIPPNDYVARGLASAQKHLDIIAQETEQEIIASLEK